MKVLFRDAVIFSQMSLCLIPEILNAMDMVRAIGKKLRVIDKEMLELRNIKRVIALPAIGINDAIGRYFIGHDGHKRA